jgi:hypothetical protein
LSKEGELDGKMVANTTEVNEFEDDSAKGDVLGMVIEATSGRTIVANVLADVEVVVVEEEKNKDEGEGEGEGEGENEEEYDDEGEEEEAAAFVEADVINGVAAQVATDSASVLTNSKISVSTPSQFPPSEKAKWQVV